MTTKTFLEKFATPLSIVVAGGLIGVGILISKSTPVANVQQQPVSEADVITQLTKNKIVKQLKIKEKDLATCIADEETAEIVDTDMSLGQQAGLRGTPHTIVIMKDGSQFPLFGALPKEMIETALAEGKSPAGQSELLESPIAEQVIRDTDHSIGNSETALATIVEYSDIDCPYCKQLHSTLQELVNEGKIVWVYRHSPIAQLHPMAYTKSIATECVAKLSNNEGFWSYLNFLIKE